MTGQLAQDQVLIGAARLRLSYRDWEIRTVQVRGGWAVEATRTLDSETYTFIGNPTKSRSPSRTQ